MKITEPACPFCARALAFADLAPRPAPRVRLGRAATFAFGAIAAAQSGCGTDTPRKPDAAPADASRDANTGPDADGDAAVPIYAAAPTTPPNAGDPSRG
ncbi:MAG TPA: hypothetical protein VL463_12645 [Kofleriaceae bacterium]|nr:hypothetical protein [Kofleriaceae bacterium]